jgi:hypothetical protein
MNAKEAPADMFIHLESGEEYYVLGLYGVHETWGIDHEDRFVWGRRAHEPQPKLTAKLTTKPGPCGSCRVVSSTLRIQSSLLHGQ